MRKNVYIGLVDRDFTLNDEVLGYFRDQNINVLDFKENFDIIKLESCDTLECKNLKYLTHLELDRIVTTQSEDEDE